MPHGIMRDGRADWDKLEQAARQTCADVSHDRALNLVRILPAVALYGRELEADRRRAERWAASNGHTLEQWREMVDREYPPRG